MEIHLSAMPLEPRSFAPYGQVIALPSAPNDPAKVQRFANVSVPNFQDGKPVFDVLYSALRPLTISMVEQHRNSTQTFIPLDSHPFVVVVATPDAGTKEDGVDYKKFLAFVSNGHQGITLSAGVWHCSPLPVGGPLVFTLIHRSPDVDLDIQLVEFRDKTIIFCAVNL